MQLGKAGHCVIEYQRRCIGTALRLLGNTLVHVTLINGRHRAVTGVECGIRLRLQEGHIPQTRLRRATQLPQQACQLSMQATDLGSTEMRAHKAVMQLQLLTQVAPQGQRVVGLLVTGNRTKAQALGCALLQRFGNRVVFEYQQAIEQRLTTLPRPTLNIEQRRVLVFAQPQVYVLDLLQPSGNGQLRVRAGDDRQCIDKQTNLLQGTRQLGRTARYCGAKSHRRLAGIALQQ